MKKLLTKLMGITLGLAMVVGAGAAIAKGNSVAPVYAADSGVNPTSNTFVIDFYDSTKLSSTAGTGLSNSNYASFVKVTTGLTKTDVVTGVSVTGTVQYGKNGGLTAGTGSAANTNSHYVTFSIGDDYAVNKCTVYATAYESGRWMLNGNAADSGSLGNKGAAFSAITAPLIWDNLDGATSLTFKKDNGSNGTQKRLTIYTIVCEYQDNSGNPSISLSSPSISGYTGEEFTVTATYANLTSDFAWGDPTGEGAISGSVTNTTGNGTDGASTYSGTLTGAGELSLSTSGGGVESAPSVAFNITQTTLNIVKESTTIGQGRSEKLECNHNASDEISSITWESDNEKVSVAADGTVTVAQDATVGLTATITATSNIDTNVSDTCEITVAEAPLIVNFAPTSNSAATATGTNPASTCSFESTYTNANQLTSGKKHTLILNLTRGIIVKSITMSMKSNKDSGAGSLSYYVDQSSTKNTITSGTFGSNNWNGSWSTTYTNVTPLNNVSIEAKTQFKLVLESTANSLYCQLYTIEYYYMPATITVDEASHEIYTNETASAEVTLANFLETPTLESNVTGDTASISSVAIGAIANNKATVTITPNKVAGTAVVRIRDAANPDTCYVDIQVTVKSVEELIEAKVSRSSLYYKYSKDGNGQFHFSSIKLRLGGFISEALWTDLNAESEIQGFGAILAKADDLSEDIKTFVDTFDNANVRNVYHPLTEKMPADADEYQKTQQGVNVDDNYYVWNLVTNISDENVNNLTERYTCVAYIKTASGVVFMQETTKSVADVARDVVQSNEELYNDEYLEGSLRYLASL